MARVTRQSFDPLYFQIEKEILNEIKLGNMQSGDRLPSEKEIAIRYAVSRITARRVLEDLVQQGIAYAQQGKGTFVALPRIREISGFLSFSHDMRIRGLNPSSKVLEFCEVIPEPLVQKKLQLQPGEKAYLLKRLRLANDEPVVLETTHLPMRLYPGLIQVDFSDNSLYSILQERYGIYPAWADAELIATSATPEEAALLGMQIGAPVLSAERLTYTRTFTVIEAVHSVNGDRFSFY
ncbi:MAG: GntR family transcriptional regulator, partial [Chloroflexi bacterium]|nr:GntR family transcriptional regulator [Chloroflexota bacterium]